MLACWQVRSDGTYDIEYDDGDVDPRVSRDLIRVLAHKVRGNVARGTRDEGRDDTTYGAVPPPYNGVAVLRGFVGVGRWVCMCECV